MQAMLWGQAMPWGWATWWVLALFVCHLLFITRYMRSEGPWQRFAAALADSSGFSKITLSCPGRARAAIVGLPFGGGWQCGGD